MWTAQRLRLLEVNTANVLVTTASYKLVVLFHIVSIACIVWYVLVVYEKDYRYLGKYCKPTRTPWCIKGGPRV